MNLIEKKTLSRIQKEKRSTIKRAALEVFSEYGLRGATLDKIAIASGLTKPNILYYYSSKDQIYFDVLSGLLDEWVAPLHDISPDGDPIDELLSYKSMNLRKFFSKYNKLNDKDVWGETYFSNLKRDAHTSNLALEYDLLNFGVNLINRMDNANFVIAFEGGIQDFVKDHKIDYQNISTGVYLPQKNNPYFNLDVFILGGITLKEAERTILTNTTSSGKLKIDSDYETYEIHTGIKRNNLSLIPERYLSN